MTVREQLEVAEQYAALWRALMPESEVPGAGQFLLWIGRYPNELVQHGINRAAGKSRKLLNTAATMTLEEKIRYASSVMKNESLGRRQHNPQNQREAA
jgi:hypothetical protein